MAKIPDLGKLTEKLDLNSLVENVKSLVNPETKIPPGEEGDQIGKHLHEMSEITLRLSETYAHQQRDLQKLASLMKAVYDALHAQHPAPKEKKEAPPKSEGQAEVKKPQETEAPKSDEDVKPAQAEEQKEAPPKSE